jgi:predicted RNA-binding protein YlxR (DUF448 family)
MRTCVECGASEMVVSLFPFYRQGRQLYVCYDCMTSHRGMLRYVCPTNCR